MIPELIACFSGILLFVVECIFYGVKISREKRRYVENSMDIPAPAFSFKGSVVLCAAAELLPILVPLQLYVIVIVCICGIFGMSIVCRERLNQLMN